MSQPSRVWFWSDIMKQARNKRGQFASLDESWTRTMPDGTRETKHLPHLLGEQEVELERLDHAARYLIVGIAAVFCASIWVFFGWGFTGAMVVALSVFFYVRLFMEPIA